MNSQVLVDRELLERVLNAGWGSETENALDDLRGFLEDAADHIEDVRAMVVPDGWIAVSDRLPDDGQKVTCSGFCFGKQENGRFVEWSIFEDGYFYGICQDDNDEDCANTDITMHSPTHWMPLPAAPGDK